MREERKIVKSMWNVQVACKYFKNEVKIPKITEIVFTHKFDKNYEIFHQEIRLKPQ